MPMSENPELEDLIEKTSRFIVEFNALCERHGAILLTDGRTPKLIFGPQRMVTSYTSWITEDGDAYEFLIEGKEDREEL